MTVTEDEAFELWCPFGRSGGGEYSTGNRDDERTNCIGKGCMLFCEAGEEWNPDTGDKGSVYRCGMAK